jgi:tetratricopeptide (TPR) repeat protein
MTRSSSAWQASSRHYLSRIRPTLVHRQKSVISDSLGWVKSKITSAKLWVALAIIIWAFVLIGDSLQDIVVLDPIGVPRTFLDAGITSQILEYRVREKIQDIERIDESPWAPDDVLRAPINQDIANIQIPEANLSIRVAEDYLRGIFHTEARHLAAAVTYSPAHEHATLQCRILRGDDVVSTGPSTTILINKADDPSTQADKVAESLALELTDLANPLLAGMYLVRHDKDDQADQVASRMLQHWPDREHEHATAFVLKGYVALARAARADKSHARALFDTAIDDDWAAIDLDNTWSFPHQALGEVYELSGELDKAEGENRRAIRFEHWNAPAHNRLGNVLVAKGKTIEGIAELRQAIEIFPNYFDPHVALGGALIYPGTDTIPQPTLDEASSEYRRSIELDATRSAPHVGLGIILTGENNLDAAAQEFRRAIELEPRNAQAHNGLANTLAAFHRFTEATNEYKLSLKIDPDYCDAHNGLGAIRFAEVELEEAANEYKKAIDCNDDYALPHHNLEQLLRKQGKAALADAERKAAHDIDPHRY